MIDHLVYATPDLPATVRAFASAGVPLIPGGPHLGVGTTNFLTGIGGGAYLEVIGPDLDQPDPPDGRPFGIDGLIGPRLVTWAVRTTDLDALLARASTAGYDAGAARSMSRKVPDGPLLEWRLAFPADEDGDGVVPFLIDWGATAHPSSALPDGVRLTELRGRHPSPGLVRSRLLAVDAELAVEESAAPGLTAVLSTADGTVELT